MAVNRHFYSAILYLIAPLIWGYFLWRAMKAPEYREGFSQRLGKVPQQFKSGGILIHCASVGEVMAASPLIEKIIHAYPGLSVTVTTTTPTGKKAILKKFDDQIQHIYLPIDWPGSCQRFIKSLAPKLVILMETELWPNFVHRCVKESIPILLANARLSEKSLAKYLKYPHLAKELFTNLDFIAAQYQSDQENFIALGAVPSKVETVGSIKFDLQINEPIKKQQANLKKYWLQNTPGAERPAWLAASIHPGEFDLILNVHQRLLKQFPDLLLVAVPRHPEKFSEFKIACQQKQFSFVSRSEQQTPTNETRVIVGDTMGEMLLFCGVANIAFVGGSLIERGGHNPLEPIACGVPAISGSSYYNFSDVNQKLIEQEVMLIAQNEQHLFEIMSEKLSNKKWLQIASHKAIKIMQSQAGCVDKMMVQVARLLS